MVWKMLSGAVVLRRCELRVPGIAHTEKVHMSKKIALWVEVWMVILFVQEAEGSWLAGLPSKQSYLA